MGAILRTPLNIGVCEYSCKRHGSMCILLILCKLSMCVTHYALYICVYTKICKCMADVYVYTCTYNMCVDTYFCVTVYLFFFLFSFLCMSYSLDIHSDNILPGLSVSPGPRKKGVTTFFSLVISHPSILGCVLACDYLISN